MPAKRKHPLPPERMAELLGIEKRKVKRRRTPLPVDFERAWTKCWQQMVQERAWPHSTEHRTQWRVAMEATKPEMKAAFLDLPTPFQKWAQDIRLEALDLNAETEQRVELVA